MSQPVVAWMPAAPDACAAYRMFIPSLNIPKSRYVFRQGAVPVEALKGVDMVVVQRQHHTGNINAMKFLRNLGYKIMYDLDDNLWSVPTYNPAQNYFREAQDGLRVCLPIAHLLTVSTAPLATAVRSAIPELKIPIMVCPNAMDMKLYKRNVLSRDDGKIVLGWAGSNTHSEDTKVIWKMLEEILDEYENVYLEIWGISAKDLPGSWLSPNPLVKHPKVHMVGWIPVGEYPSRFSTSCWDIAFAPLEDNRFNRSKSNIKMLEAAAVGAVCLASDVRPYSDFCSQARELDWLLCRRPQDWKSKVVQLIQNADLRRSLADVMYKVMTEKFSIDVLKPNWTEAITACMNL